MPKAKVLVTDAPYKHALGAARYLARAGYQVEYIGEGKHALAMSRYARRAPIPKNSFNDEGFEQFVAFLQQQPHQVLLAIGANSVALVNRHRAELQPFCHIALPAAESLSTAFDKYATAELAHAIGVPCPRTWLVEPQHHNEALWLALPFPLVVKRRNELHHYQPVHYVSDVSKLREVLNEWSGPPPILQEYIAGEGQGFFALYQHGICKRVFMHRRIRETPPSGGASCCAESIFKPDLLEQGMKVLDALKWHGVAMVEFRRSVSTGELFLMEINPKFWGSLDLALCAGVNFPALTVQVALGEELTYSEDYQVGLRFHWPLDGELRHVWECPPAIGAVLKDLLIPTTKSNIWWNDPLPHLTSALDLVGSMWRLIR